MQAVFRFRWFCRSTSSSPEPRPIYNLVKSSLPRVDSIEIHSVIANLRWLKRTRNFSFFSVDSLSTTTTRRYITVIITRERAISSQLIAARADNSWLRVSGTTAIRFRYSNTAHQLLEECVSRKWNTLYKTPRTFVYAQRQVYRSTHGETRGYVRVYKTLISFPRGFFVGC